MNLKHLLLGSAALLMMATAAHAADLPAEAEPVEYVKVCDAYGSGFFYIPGTQTCLRISAIVRADFSLADHLEGVDGRSYNNYRTRGRVFLYLETNTQSDIGLIHAFIDERLTLDSQSSSAVDFETSPAFRNAFVDIINDFGIFTAGRANSYFDVYGTDSFYYVLGGDDPTNGVNLIAYKFALGGDFYAAVSLEDAASSPRPYRRASGLGFNYGGQELPDLVASIGGKGNWGAAQIMGVLHQVRSGVSTADSELGWAVGAGLSAVKIPHTIFSVGAQATYGEGTTGYITTGNGGPLSDARYDAGGDLDLTKAWSLRGGVTATLTKTWQAVLTGSYADIDHYGDAYDYKTYTAAAQLDWKPVKDLLIGAEIEYENVDGKSGYLASNVSGDVWGGTVRVQRKF